MNDQARENAMRSAIRFNMRRGAYARAGRIVEQFGIEPALAAVDRLAARGEVPAELLDEVRATVRIAGQGVQPGAYLENDSAVATLAWSNGCEGRSEGVR